jgi:hypothetical protein
VIILALRCSEYGWEYRLVEEREAQQDGAHAGGARVERVSWFRYPVLIPLGTACLVPYLHKYQIPQWFKIIL